MKTSVGGTILRQHRRKRFASRLPYLLWVTDPRWEIAQRRLRLPFPLQKRLLRSRGEKNESVGQLSLQVERGRVTLCFREGVKLGQSLESGSGRQRRGIRGLKTTQTRLESLSVACPYTTLADQKHRHFRREKNSKISN